MKDFKLDMEPKITSGFTAPEGYFDTLSEKVLVKISQEKPEVVSIYRSKKVWYFMAAALLVALLSVPLYTKYAASQKEIDSTTLEDYITDHGTVSEDEIVDLLDTEDLKKIKIELKIQDKDIEDALYSNSDIEQFILN